MINLIKEYQENDLRKDTLDKIINYSEKLEKNYISDKFKVGDEISFIGGYNNDIEYISKIMGFDDEGGIYLIWDCYWLPIKDIESRNIKIIKK